MRRKKYNRLQFRYVVIGVVVVIVILLIIFSKTLRSNKTNKVVGFFKDSVVAIQNVVSYPFRFIFSSADNLGKLSSTMDENEVLSSNVDKVDYLISENLELKKQLEAMKDELGITNTLVDYECINATVISRNVGYWYNNITINKGSSDGIVNDMIVINSKGLVGRVYSTSKHNAVVRLITTSDTNNKISVSVSHGGKYIYGLINRYNYSKNVLEVEGISNTEEVSVGDKVYTSGLGGLFPSGILIGDVKDITTDEYDLSKIIQVTPSADFNNLNYVSILKRKDKE